jgi:hypothetical protein
VVKKKGRPQTFAEVVANLPEPGPPYVATGTWTSPIQVGEFEHPDGILWELRQRDPDAVAVARNVRPRDVLVVEKYWGYDTQEIPHAQRDAFWAAVGPYYTQTVDRGPGDQTIFRVGLFANAIDQSLLLFERDC